MNHPLKSQHLAKIDALEQLRILSALRRSLRCGLGSSRRLLETSNMPIIFEWMMKNAIKHIIASEMKEDKNKCFGHQHSVNIYRSR